MSDETVGCLYCAGVEGLKSKKVYSVMYEHEGTHEGKKFYLLQINVAGDRNKCNDVRDLVCSYLERVLGYEAHWNPGTHPTPKA